MQLSLRSIPPGQAGTDATVKQLGRLVGSSIRRGKLRLLGLEILRKNKIDSRAPMAVAQCLYSWVRTAVSYVHDPVGLETIQDPEITTYLKAGDCDDHSALLIALAESVGLNGRFVVIGENPDSFVHIYPELEIAGQWIPADTTGQIPFGRAFKTRARKTYSSDGDLTMSGNTGLGVIPVQSTRVPRDSIKKAAYKSAMTVLQTNWQSGKISENDVRGYLRVFAEGNQPGRGTLVDVPMRKAIEDFLAHVQSRNLRSSKLGGLNGLEGLDGFLNSVWEGVKGGVKAVVGGAAGSGIPGISQAGSLVGGILSSTGGGTEVGEPNEGIQYGHSPSAWKSLADHEQVWVRNMTWTGRPDIPEWLAAYNSIAAAQGARAGQRYAHEVMISGVSAATNSGESGSLFSFAPSVQVPEGLIQTNVSPEAARAGMATFLSDPKILIMLAGVTLAAVALVRGKK